MLGDLGRMMKLAAQMKAKLPAVQRKLEESEYWAEAGGGAVRAAVNGKGRLLDVKIDPGALAEEGLSSDAEMLADLIKAAVSAAQKKASEAAAKAMHELTGGVKLPGLEGMM